VSERVVFYTRDGCHLCDDAAVVVEAVCAQTSASWKVVDIDSDPELVARYNDKVPVVTVDGEEIGFWTIDSDVLRAALT